MSEDSHMYNFLKDFSEKEITYSLYGLLLGDGNYRNGWVCNAHTDKQDFYCEWLEKIFSNYGLKTSSRYHYIRHTTFGEIMYSHINIKVPKKFYFESMNKCFNDGGKKIISDYVMEHINEFGLLLWFLDDGQWHVSTKNNSTKRFGYLNTQSFSYEENCKIQKMFKERFGIKLKIHKDNSGINNHKNSVYYRLYFNAENFRKFFDIVRPYLKYIPKEFYYKFDMKYFPNRLKSSIEFSEKYNLTV